MIGYPYILDNGSGLPRRDYLGWHIGRSCEVTQAVELLEVGHRFPELSEGKDIVLQREIWAVISRVPRSCHTGCIQTQKP